MAYCLYLCVLYLYFFGIASAVPPSLDYKKALMHTNFTATLINDLSNSFPTQEISIVESTLADALALAAASEHLPVGALSCDVDFDATCPEGWADAGDGETCWSPAHYNGPCNDSIKFGTLSPISKLQQIHVCGADFMCRRQCTQDFGQACPVGWNFDVANTCVASADYDGQCAKRKRFEADNVAGKMEWGESCGLRWPCHETLQRSSQKARSFTQAESNRNCVEDFSVLCPQGWTRSENNNCHAPVTYAGPCGFTIAPESYTPRMKEAWGNVCLANWRCVVV